MTTLTAHEYAMYKTYGLKDYCEYSDKVTYVNQRDYPDYTEGEWYYDDEDEYITWLGRNKVIYHGTFGNYNSPGYSHYTYAEVYDMDNADDVKEYEASLLRFSLLPEYLDNQPC